VKNIWFSIVLIVLSGHSFAQEEHLLKVFFRYGSIPETGYEYIEYEETGGLHGGHVSLGLDSLEIGFTSENVIHLFARKNDIKGIFYWEYLRNFEEQVAGKKYITFLVPLTQDQYIKLRSILMAYIDTPPYDYAFFGMRCASATYDVLSQIGLFKSVSRGQMIISNFYPRLFRRKMMELAHKNGYSIIRIKGRKSRIWEKDL